MKRDPRPPSTEEAAVVEGCYFNGQVVVDAISVLVADVHEMGEKLP